MKTLGCIFQMENITKKNILKIVFGCIMFIFMMFNTSDFANASDYKYKVLDPKYNPEAEQLINGTLPPERTMYVEKKEGFDIGTFLAIFAIVTFPFAIVYIAVRTFKEVMKEPSEDEQTIGNIKIVKDSDSEDEEQDTLPEEIVKLESSIPTNSYKKINTKEIPQSFVKKYFDFSTSLEQIPNPRLLYTSPLASNKGFCLVQYNQKYSLIGYINDEIFLLNQFESIKTKEIRARLSETKKTGERYIVKLDEYNALVEVSDNKMDLITNI